MYEVKMSDAFLEDLFGAPKQVQKKFRKDIRPHLEEAPECAHGDTIKKLGRYKSLWRYRIGDYRVIYKVENRTVTCLKIGDRKSVYDTFPDPDTKAGLAVVANHPDLIEPRPQPQEVLDAQEAVDEEQTFVDEPLPLELTPEVLQRLGVDGKWHQVLQACSTSGDFLECHAPPRVLHAVLEHLYPRNAGDIANVPVRSDVDDEVLQEFLDGKRELASLLLALDDDQKPFVRRFEEPAPEGPWLLKGGPGSGKSTIALYCVAALVRAGRERLIDHDRPLRILFTTYTNSLTNASSHLLACLDSVCHDQVTVKTVNSEATRVIGAHLEARRGRSDFEFCTDQEYSDLVNDVLVDLHKSGQQSTFRIGPDGRAYRPDIKFVENEVEWIILGHDCVDSLSKYQDAERAGRGRRLGKNQKDDMFRVFQEIRTRLKKRRKTTHAELLWWATRVVQPEYDYVFVDEAQDLSPAAIRFCVGLARNAKSVFLTADINQSIYGCGVSWRSISDALNFRGRTSILKKNYRSTRPILYGIEQIAQGLDQADEETLHENAVYDGDVPILRFVTDERDEISATATFLDRSALEARCGYAGCAVLCYRKKDAIAMAQALPSRMNARFLHSKENILSHEGVKILTMHGSKGLEFPAVVVARLEDGVLPPMLSNSEDVEEIRQSLRRLFFVACSRAMKRLMVTAPVAKPSVFVKALTDDRWEVVR